MQILFKTGINKPKYVSWEYLTEGLWTPISGVPCVILVTKNNHRIYISKDVIILIEQISNIWDNNMFIPFNETVTIKN